jgi:membrane protease YdiL (CAAX protease family)
MGCGSVVAALAARSTWTADGGTLGAYLARLGLLVVVLLPAALFEELAFRGLLVAGLARGIGRPAGVAAAAILFAAAHRNNPDVTPLALGNIALAGIFLGATFLARGGLWTATGAHLGWNLSLAALGAPVSGLPFEIPWIEFNPGAPAWITGGPFGPEGGLLATVALIAGTVAVARWKDFPEGR